MIGYRFLEPAAEEMADAAAYYESQVPGLGLEFLDTLQLVIDRHRANPELGQILEEPLQFGFFPRFPFTLFYFIEPETLVIVAIAHQRRRPGYWKSRILH